MQVDGICKTSGRAVDLLTGSGVDLHRGRTDGSGSRRLGDISRRDRLGDVHDLLLLAEHLLRLRRHDEDEDRLGRHRARGLSGGGRSGHGRTTTEQVGGGSMLRQVVLTLRDDRDVSVEERPLGHGVIRTRLRRVRFDPLLPTVEVLLELRHRSVRLVVLAHVARIAVRGGEEEAEAWSVHGRLGR
jgi:hypothetical protein